MLFFQTKTLVHFNNVLCLLLFGYYFADLYSKLFQLKSSLNLIPNSQTSLPNPILCINLLNNRNYSAFHYQPKRVEVVHEFNRTQQLKFEGSFFASKYLLCFVYRIENTTKVGFFVIWPSKGTDSARLWLYYDSMYEIIHGNQLVFYSFYKTGYAHEIIMIKSIYKNDFRRNCIEKDNLNEILKNYPVRMGFLNETKYDKRYEFRYQPKIVQQVLDSSCEKGYQYVIRIKPLNDLIGHLADTAFVVSYQIQDPQLHFHIRFEITLPDFFWYAFQVRIFSQVLIKSKLIKFELFHFVIKNNCQMVIPAV